MDVVDEVILVDDVSHDHTVDIAERLGLKVVVHVQNRGYGGNQKTCYLEALRSGADVVVMVHPDNQYDSTLVPQMIQPILDNRADIVLGSRLLSGTALLGGHAGVEIRGESVLDCDRECRLRTAAVGISHRLSRL